MKTKINLQIYFGFISAVLLVFAVGTSTYFSLREQSEDAKWVTHTYKVQTVTDRILRSVVDMESGRRGYRATGDEKFLEPYHKGAQAIPQLLIEWRSLIVDQENKKNAAIVETRIADVLAFWKTLDDGIIKGSDVHSNTTIEKQKVDAVRASMDNFFSRQDELLAIRTAKNEKAISTAATVLLIGTFITLTVVIILLIIILKEFRNRKKAELQVEENYNKVIDLNQKSENQNWILTGVAHINNSLQGSENLHDLTANLLDSLIAYTNKNAAAIYVFDGERLQLTATAGINKQENVSYEIGEGLAGQAVKSKELKIIHNIPATYIRISSALMDADGASAVFIPLWMGKNLKGVIEVFSWKSFTENELGLFEYIGDNIAIAINSAQSKAEAEKLLEEVQQQKELLVSQQEELRQTNEELTKQAEELQASEEELKVQEEELRQINAELEEKNEAVQMALTALDDKAKELELTNKFKSEFLANMSHELRTPLNSILILAKMLSDNQQKNLNEKQIEYASIIHKSGNDLLELINDILDLSKIEAGKISLHIEEVLLKDIEIDMALTFKALAQQKGITFSTAIDESAPQSFFTDKQRVEQVIKNLLSNSFKFTPQGGEVILTFRLKDAVSNLLAISVKDSGIGIPPEKQQLIFEAFQQADGSTSRKFGGTGLGLSISRELMHLLGGKINLHSEAGKGSEFVLLLPIQKIAAKDHPEKQTFENSTAIVKEQSLIEDDRLNISADDKTMLIIEDDLVFSTILRDFARSKGYKTIVALQGDEGLYCANKYVPSAITLDMKLPEVDGAAILQKLKADKRTKNIPVHIISGEKDMSAIQSGAIAWLKKPVSERDLESAFDKIRQVLHSQLKKVLLYTSDEQMVADIQHLLQQTNKDLQLVQASTIEEAESKCSIEECDCIIVDTGESVEKELSNIRRIKAELGSSKTPLIICINTDISASLEKELKKLSDVVIRTSSSSNQRLLEELELFLYKVQEEDPFPHITKGLKITGTDNDLKEKMVLLVDDDMRNVFSLTAALESQEMNVITAGDGKEAIEALKQHNKVDIILMDIMMPEMDGYEAIRYIRSEMNMTKVPIIALTAKAMTGDKEKIISAGASDYITKPVDLSKLFSLMRVWISQ